MQQRHEPSPFIDTAAVETWDTWYRWRENGRLRDLSVDATWQRVAQALAEVEATRQSEWSARIFAAQSRWQIVLDERILATAGTRSPQWPLDPVAVLNAAAFVESPIAANATFDAAAFKDVAALAVRCLDNALLQSAAAGRLPLNLRVGLIGVADALALLGKRYDSPAGRVTAGTIAQALAEGCLRGSVQLAAERGPFPEAGQAQVGLARQRGLPADLIEAMTRIGVRHARLTEISSQPHLAVFANNVRNALDPVDPVVRAAAAPGPGTQPRLSPSYAVTLARTLTGSDEGVRASLPKVSLAEQIEMRGVVQPWIDAIIDYPFQAISAGERNASSYWQNLATAHRLGPVVIAG